MKNPNVSATLRNEVFDYLFNGVENNLNFVKINDRQYGVLLTDANGTERYVRIGAIVAEERNDMTARELMESEIKAYNDTQERKAEKAKASAEKKAKDEAKRKETVGA